MDRLCWQERLQAVVSHSSWGAEDCAFFSVGTVSRSAGFPFPPRVPGISSEATAAPRSRAGLEAELWLGLQGHLVSRAGEGGPVGGWQPLPVLLSPPHLTF